MNSLAEYAVSTHNSKGRAITEPAPEGRSEFQRDRDNIKHKFLLIMKAICFVPA